MHKHTEISAADPAAKTIHWPVALTIAGSDTSGGAGLQADLRSFQRHHVYGTTVVTAITAQNGDGVQAMDLSAPALVRQQLLSVFNGMPVRAAKTGMLGNAETIMTVAEVWRDHPAARRLPLVVDPVMVATSGARLLDPQAIHCLRDQLLPLAHLVTPNLPELEALTGLPVGDTAQRLRAAQALLDLGCDAVLIKDGHGDSHLINDILLTRENQWTYRQSRIDGEFHGTGCTCSAAICAALARGLELSAAVDQALATLHALLGRARRGLVGEVHYLPI